MEINADKIICKINKFIRANSLKQKEPVGTRKEDFQNLNAESETRALKKKLIGIIHCETNEIDEDDIEYDSEELIENLVCKICMSLKQSNSYQ